MQNNDNEKSSRVQKNLKLTPQGSFTSAPQQKAFRAHLGLIWVSTCFEEKNVCSRSVKEPGNQ